jgi:hypothetical protein
VCRTDPIVTLSNGYQMTLWSDIYTDVSLVRGVSYTLHVPVGVSVQGVSYDQNGSLETLTVVADETGGRYSVTTNVSLISGIAPVTVFATRQNSTVAMAVGVSGLNIALNW